MASNRRDFIKTTTLGGIATLGMTAFLNMGYASILGSNERLNVAVIGVNGRAKALTLGIKNYTDAKIIYTCDVDDLIIEKNNKYLERTVGYVPKVVKDFRKVLEDKDVDAVFIATPEHWHAPMAIMALQAGKHLYVEKPCSHNPHENELLVAAQKKYGKIVQMGNQQRSAESSILAVQEIKDGIIGEVYKGEAYYSNNRGSIGIGKEIEVPSTLDWDLWQGPAPRQKYKDNIHTYNWHWFRKWGTGEIHNNGTHEIDVCRWAMGLGLPDSVTSFGGKFTYDDDWEFTDNQQATFNYSDGKFITWTGHSRGLIQPNQPDRGATIYGSKGAITLSRNEYKLFGLDGKLIKTVEEKAKSETINTVGAGALDIYHVGNFFDAIRLNKKQNSPIDDASISTLMCHLGNISQDVKRTIYMDKDSGKIKDDKEAMKHWERDYEKGWEPTL